MVTFKMIQKPSGVFAFDGEIIGGTEKAIKVEINGKSVWFPRSALKSDYTFKHWFKLDSRQMAIVEPVSRFFAGDTVPYKSQPGKEQPEKDTGFSDSYIAQLVQEQLAQG